MEAPLVDDADMKGDDVSELINVGTDDAAEVVVSEP